MSLDRIARLAKSANETRSERDLALWKAWKRNPSDAAASALLAQVAPLISREASKWDQTMARPLLETEGKRLAMQAFHGYDPSKGAALGTHVVNQLQRMSRLSYANQNVARLPENKMLWFHAYHRADARLGDELGRSPTTDEIADELGWSIPRVEEFRRSIGRRELLESGGHDDSGASGLHDDARQDHTLDFVHHGLPPTQKAIFEHLTGYAGAETLSNTQIQRKLGLTQGQYSYQKARLIEHVSNVQNGKR